MSSYGGDTRSSGVVKIVKDIDIELEDYDVLLVEDILDSGRTLSYVCDMLRTRHPASIRVNRAFQLTDIRQVAVALVKIQAVAHHKLGSCILCICLSPAWI